MNRESKIKFLTDDDFEFIASMTLAGQELLETYLRDGFRGYNNFTDTELDQEIKNRKEVNDA